MSKGHENHILDLRKCLTNKKVSKIKFTGLEKPCVNPYKGTGRGSCLSSHRKIM